MTGLYAPGLGAVQPSRLAMEPTGAFALAGGSLGALYPLVTERGLNPRLEGLGCQGDRTCAPCAAAERAAIDRERRLDGVGWLGVIGSPVPAAYRSATRSLLGQYADALDGGLDALERAHDVAAAENFRQELGGLYDLADLNEPSLAEVPHLKDAAGAALGQAIEAERTVWSLQANTDEARAAEAQLRGFLDAGRAVAVHVRARARSDDLSEALTPEEAEEARRLEGGWQNKIRIDQEIARADACRFSRVLTGEVDLATWAAQCQPRAWGALKLLGLGLALVLGLGLYGRVRG